MKKSIILFILISVSISVFCSDINNSLVKIFSTKQENNYSQPWMQKSLRKGRATGFIIENDRIITNAHAVMNAKFIQLQKEGSPEKFIADVEFISQACDLAILTVEDNSFFEDTKPLKILSELPRLMDKIKIYGYPIGGDHLSITEGVVSRIEHRSYAYSDQELSVIQTDAAINPGNSGGPALLGDKVIGVAFQGISRADNIGYLIPAHIINHFLADISDGDFSGIPSLEFEWQRLENETHREMLGLNEKQQGILVTYIPQNSPLESILKVNDVILKIEGVDLELDGTIVFREKERTSYKYILENKNYGNKVGFEIFRDKKVEKITLILDKKKKAESSIKYEEYGSYPRYYIKSGFIFEPLTYNYLKPYIKSFFSYGKETPYNLINAYNEASRDYNKNEIVILVSVLSDVSNIGYQAATNKIIKKVNNEAVESFVDFVNKVEAAKDFIVLEDEFGEKYVINQLSSKDSDERIIETYNIKSLYSKDVAEMIE